MARYYYAVQRGRSTGVFNSWDECKAEVNGYPGARYKKFNTYDEARGFAGGSGGPPHRIHGSSFRRPVQYERDSCDSSYRSSSSFGDRDNSYKRTNYGWDERRDRTGSGRRYYGVRSSNPSVRSEIFDSWEDCKNFVRGRSGLSYQKFDTKADAEAFVDGLVKDDGRFVGMSDQDFRETYGTKDWHRNELENRNVYCDGSAFGNGTNSSKAGYGVYFEGSEHENISEPLRSGAPTNNRAEIQAVSHALDQIWQNLSEKDQCVKYQIKTDSEYVAKLLNDRYAGYDEQKLASLPNSDLIVPLVKKFSKVKKFYDVNGREQDGSNKFKVDWVRGHAGDEGNERADALAKMGASRY
ncbi:LAMI_0C05204g1_1 [Lachancea mirantina]|uniref:Ribonuclease H n=1 Tax=Lachancea mirantina TaxID=1230905 RepID=A0A1G4J2Z3_9SACH|nr:LAMI_0C05204g1_1 [Lachancea mirantina]